MSKPNLKFQIFIFTIILFTALFLIPSKTEAAKKFPGRKNVTRRSLKSGGTRSLIPAMVRYRKDKQGILLSFANFSGIESLSYSFTYTTNGTPQGAGGTITSANNPTSERELLFGTCSTTVCTYHHNLESAQLILTAKLTNGKTATKRYRIKTYQ